MFFYQIQTVSIPGSGKSPGKGNGNPLQYFCLENSMNRGAWCAMGSIGSQRVIPDWSDLACTHVCLIHALFQGILQTSGIKSRSPTLQVDSLPSEPPGKPLTCFHNSYYAISLLRNVHGSLLCTKENLDSVVQYSRTFQIWSCLKNIYIVTLCT